MKFTMTVEIAHPDELASILRYLANEFDDQGVAREGFVLIERGTKEQAHYTLVETDGD